MMHRPPYVPKLHSSQIRTSVSGRTYESQTGLCVDVSAVYACGAAEVDVPFAVTFLAQTADS
jgi:hypothetical protein